MVSPRDRRALEARFGREPAATDPAADVRRPPASTASPAPARPVARAPAGPAVRAGSPSPSWSQLQRGTNLRIWRLTRVPVLVLLGAFTLSHLLAQGAWVFVDHFNLVLHEAGHVAFMWGPRTLYILGGTIGQLFWPIFFAAYFWWWRRELFATSACVWWFGENLMNVARYMADANFLVLPLTGGGEHDWETLFIGWNLLHRAGRIAGVTRVFGVLFMLAGFAAMVYLTARPRRAELEAPPPG